MAIEIVNVSSESNYIVLKPLDYIPEGIINLSIFKQPVLLIVDQQNTRNVYPLLFDTCFLTNLTARKGWVISHTNSRLCILSIEDHPYLSYPPPYPPGKNNKT